MLEIKTPPFYQGSKHSVLTVASLTIITAVNGGMIAKAHATVNNGSAVVEPFIFLFSVVFLPLLKQKTALVFFTSTVIIYCLFLNLTNSKKSDILTINLVDVW